MTRSDDDGYSWSTPTEITKTVKPTGWNRYWNDPLLMHEGKSLEAIWPRAMLDLLSAIALIDHGRFVGRVISYKAGHALDTEMIRLLYKYNGFKPVEWAVSVP